MIKWQTNDQESRRRRFRCGNGCQGQKHSSRMIRNKHFYTQGFSGSNRGLTCKNEVTFKCHATLSRCECVTGEGVLGQCAGIPAKEHRQNHTATEKIFFGTLTLSYRLKTLDIFGCVCISSTHAIGLMTCGVIHNDIKNHAVAGGT